MATKLQRLEAEVSELRAEVAELRGLVQKERPVRVVREKLTTQAAGVLPQLGSEQCCSVHGRIRPNIYGVCPKCMLTIAEQQAQAARATA